MRRVDHCAPGKRAADARTVEQLIGERIGAAANQHAGAVLAAGVDERTAFDNESESLAERRERIERAMRLGRCGGTGNIHTPSTQE